MDLADAAADPVACAELIAPDIDRLRLAIANEVKTYAAPVALAHGLPPAAVLAAGYLRNVYPNRDFDPRAVRAVFTYQSGAPIEEGLATLLASGHLAETSPTCLNLTDAGRAVLADIVAAADTVAGQLWPDTVALIEIIPTCERAVAAAVADGGEATSVMAPSAGNPAGLSPAGWCAELLTGLRFHRFDSHIAAWRAAGLTAEDVTTLGDEPRRQAIETDTNQRAAAPYRVLSPAERASLLAGLADLPG